MVCGSANIRTWRRMFASTNVPFAASSSLILPHYAGLTLFVRKFDVRRPVAKHREAWQLACVAAVKQLNARAVKGHRRFMRSSLMTQVLEYAGSDTSTPAPLLKEAVRNRKHAHVSLWYAQRVVRMTVDLTGTYPRENGRIMWNGLYGVRHD